MKRVVWLGLAALLLVNLALFLVEANRPAQATVATGVQVGLQAPDFELTDLDGGQVRLSDLRGRPVILNFWATWCPPCRAEMPEIQAFHERHPGQVTVLGINLQESPAVVKEFVEANGYDWTMLLDSDGSEKSRFRVRVIPTSYFLDARGVIRRIYYGALTLEMMEQFWRETQS